MRKAERLFQIVQFLRRRRRAVTARTIADHFNVCERTVYRDLQALMASGVPISGAAGVGYLFDKQYELPPVLFQPEELEALALGAAMVNNWTDDAFGARARAALERIEAVLPPTLQTHLQQLVLLSAPSAARLPWEVSFSTLRESIRAQRYLRFRYVDENTKETRRRVRPLGMVFFGPVWLLVAWCELRRGFRNFRLDRMRELEELPERFPEEKGRTLVDYLRAGDCAEVGEGA
jgi:predicted DNA-binding transcriptional regulator YafY